MGYTKNVTLRGAPYDFRYTPDASNGTLVDAIKALVEAATSPPYHPYPDMSRHAGACSAESLYWAGSQETYSANNNSAVVLLSHSMGGLHEETLYCSTRIL